MSLDAIRSFRGNIYSCFTTVFNVLLSFLPNLKSVSILKNKMYPIYFFAGCNAVICKKKVCLINVNFSDIYRPIYFILNHETQHDCKQVYKYFV